MSSWEQEITECWTTFNPEEPGDFVARIDRIAAQRGDGDAAALFERAAARDSTGLEDAAESLYREALATNQLDPYRRARATIQLASTLRLLGCLEESEALLLAERAQDIGSPLRDELHAILALTWLEQGRAVEAAAIALQTLAPHLSRYQRSVRSNASDYLDRWLCERIVPRR